MRTEDRFYFGKPGQPERFAISSSDLNYAKSQIRSASPERLREIEKELLPLAKSGDKNAKTLLAYLKQEWDDRYRSTYSRPGQPERFGLEDACWDGYEPVGTKQKDGRTVPNCVPKAKNEQPDVMSTPMGEHGDIGKLVSRALREGAEAYRAGKPGVLNARDPKYKGMSEKELEVYGNFWMRGWDGESIKAASARPVRKGIDRPGMRFARPGQPERFAASGWKTIEAYLQVLDEEFGTPRGKEAAQTMMRAAESLGGSVSAALRTAIRTAATSKNVTDRGRAIGQIEDMLESASFSRPGQPERFSDAMRGLSGPWTPNPRGKHRYKPGDRVKLKHWNNPLEGRVDRLVRDMYGLPAYVVYWDKGGTAQVHDAEVFSCPGQPERFDASSLNRADFSDASKSPILGKLLAAKAMPDGGWRAVQAGSDTLVISFEDGDVAGDFGKRAASKGFNATSPVQAIGRYWNVEVKNGK